jgi:hypothetical protein
VDDVDGSGDDNVETPDVRFQIYNVEIKCSTSAKSDAMPTCALFVECGGVDKTMT